jgi:hypothetical protein
MHKSPRQSGKKMQGKCSDMWEREKAFSERCLGNRSTSRPEPKQTGWSNEQQYD